MRPKLVIRADASPTIGTGHVMRCLALAQQWERKGGKVVFVYAEMTDSVLARLSGYRAQRVKAAGGSAADALETARVAAGCRWLVTDGYHFETQYRRGIREAGIRHLMIDDFGGEAEYAADFIVNPNTRDLNAHYAAKSFGSRILGGPRYSFLREEFRPWRSWDRPILGAAKKILVTLGGADPAQATGPVLEILGEFPNLEILVILGGSHPNADSLRDRFSGRDANFRWVIDTPNMPALMAEADVAIAAAGSTAWELAFMGLPTVLLTIFPNQEFVARELQREGAAEVVDWRKPSARTDLRERFGYLLADVVSRRKMSAAARLVVDGRGGERVRTRMAAFDVRLRAAEIGDCDAIWKIANEPEVRAVSFQSEPIPWETHLQWYGERLQDSQCRLYVITGEDGDVIGYTRFDLEETVARISVALSARARGFGFGPAVISRSCEEIFKETGVSEIEAFIKLDNEASLQAFAAADFDPCRDGSLSLAGGTAIRYVLERERMLP